MRVVLNKAARAQIASTSRYINQINTEGSGERWADKLTAFIRSYAKPNVTYSPCKHHTLARYNYQCITYGDWVIAFRISGDKFNVRRIVHGSRLA
jgi:plasmid stabilization system protein ParE